MGPVVRCHLDATTANIVVTDDAHAVLIDDEYFVLRMFPVGGARMSAVNSQWRTALSVLSAKS